MEKIVAFTLLSLSAWAVFRGEGLKASNPRLWIKEVKTKWKPPKGLFAEGSSQEIARIVSSESKDYSQAIKRLQFYINRAGKNLTGERLRTLEAAKRLVKKYFED